MSKPLRLLAALCATLLAPASLLTPMPLQAQATPTALSSARVIVKYKSDSTLLRKQAQSAREAHAMQAQALGERIGMTLHSGIGVADRTQVVFASGMSSQALADRLSRESDVEFAVPDRRKQRSAAPNDPRYLSVADSNGPAVGQWYLRAPQAAAATTSTTVVSSINAEAAWDVTQGNRSVVVAVLDSGIRFDHPDLKRVAEGGNLLPGYDMLADDTGRFAGTFASAGDGDGRDPDPSDTGDWITQAESDDSTGLFYKCPVGDSSWHGTQVAGLIGALTDNGVGMASVGRKVRILPVRVLGRCGGYDSDILAGMNWAAGINVPGVPANPNPAKIINMSLGASGVACTASYQDVVNAVVARGVTIVASAGNSAGHAVGEPANCTGVIAVGALRHVGTKVGFSDLGTEVAISAPGGNCSNTTGACLYPILTTTNAGKTTPVANSAVYTDAFNPSLGTSFSAPLVAGTAALMLSARPTLTPADIRALLRSTARAFPTTSPTAGVPQCTAPQYDSANNPIDQGECYCTASTCGAGMLDAAAALQAVLAQASIVANIRVQTTPAAVGSPVSLSAASTALVAGSPGIKSYAWSVSNGAGTITSATNAVEATLTPSAAGIIDVSLTVVDNLDRSSTATASVYVPGAVAAASGDAGGGGALGLGWLLALGVAVAATRRSARRPQTP